MKIKKSTKILSLFLAVLMLATSIPFAAFATDESGIKPAEDTSLERPFVTMKPSERIRIPSLITMDDGTLVAHGEARWNGGMDGGGNDTMIARSSDNGINWTYTFVNYYPDNGNEFNKASTSTCDSAIATDGKRLYLLTTFFPAGYALNGYSANNQVKSGDTAFDANGRIKLRLLGESSYNYYLGDFDETTGRAKVFNNNGEVYGDYNVDHDFYLYDGTNRNGNLFYSDCLFQTVKTTFLMFRTSDDNGATWSDFTLVNAKKTDEAFYGVGPGRGIVTADGTIAFACYKWNGTISSQRSSFIYSRDGGKTWTRTPNMGELKTWVGHGTWHSECQLVELDDNTIRMFARNDFGKIIYGDAKVGSDGVTYEWINGAGTDGDLWGTAGKGPTVLDNEINGKPFSICADCQYSVIKYSKKMQWNGQYYDALIVSSPSNGGRSDGTFTVLLMDKNYNVVNAVQYQYTSGFFAYSCITELSDGRIAVLFEDDSAARSMDFKIFDVDKISGFRIPELGRVQDIELIKGDNKTFFVSENVITNSDPTIASASFNERYASEGNLGFDAGFTGEKIHLSEALYNFTKTPDGLWNIGNMGVWLTVYQLGLPSTKDKKDIVVRQEGEYFQFIDGSGEALYFWRDTSKIYQWDRTTAYGTDGSSGSGDYAGTLFEVFRPAKIDEQVNDTDPVPGYVRITDIKEIADGGQYLIGCKVDGSYYFLYPSLSNDNTYSHSVKCNGNKILAGYFMTVDALASGKTTIVNGLNTYNITVSDFSREIIGVVDYDPVIYTHGTSITNAADITTIGNRIADGNTPGEKQTNYRMRDNNYTVIGVDAVSATTGELLANCDIIPDGTKLTGILPLANTESYKSYESGTYVTLKTQLRDSNGLVWIQTDRLYVASHPVNAHVIVGNSIDAWEATLPLSTLIVANGSYGNTMKSDTVFNGYGNGYNLNALNINEGNAMTYAFTKADAIYNTNGSDKYAGVGENNHEKSGGSRSASYTHNIMTETQVNNNIILGYYYYDKSSPKNEGITADPNDPTSFSINIAHNGVKSSGANQNTPAVTVDSTSVTKLSGSGSIKSVANPFIGYTVGNDNANQVETVNLSTKNDDGTDSVSPNTTSSFTGLVYHGERAYYENKHSVWTDKATAINNIRLTFEVKMCDKSVERKAFEDSFVIRKSTWYTTDTWKQYMGALLVYEEYLNNYTLLTTDALRTVDADYTDIPYQDVLYRNGDTTIELSYNNLTKRADFSPLEEAVESKADIYQNGIELESGNYTPDSYNAFLNAYEAGNALLNDERYDTDDERANAAGYIKGPETPTQDGEYDILDNNRPYNPDHDRLQLQKEIEQLADDINNTQPVLAADDDAYVAARDVSKKIDKTAYTDDGAKVDGAVETGDTNIYKDYNGKLYVNLPKTEVGQGELDGYTTDLLEEMNVSNEASMAKTFHVDFTVTVDGTSVNAETDEHQADYRYGTVANIDLTQFMGDEYTVKCIVNSVDADTTKKETEINLADCGYKVSILMQENLEVKVEVTTNPAITVVDYFGTVIAALNGTSVTINGDKLTVGDVTVTAVQVPKYKFVGWSLEDGTHEITSATTIKQVGILNSTDHIVTAVNGKVNGKDRFDAKHFDLKMTLTADDANAKYWTRTVDGVTSLASYENKFVVFTTNEDVTFTAYNDVNDLPNMDLVNQVNEAIPAVYATGYMANDKFVMSCDYSAPDTVKVLSAGVIYSNTASTADTLVKGASGTVAYASNNISHWNGASEAEKLTRSGTYTMSKSKNIYDGTTHYMRAFVCYTAEYNGKDIPYVAYSDKIYKCENGVVTAVN